MSKQRKNQPQQQTSKPSGPTAASENATPKTPIDASIWLISIGLGALAFLLYANTLGHGYVLDDDLALKLHNLVPKGSAAIGEIFSAPYREGCFGGCLYRPIPLSLFALEWQYKPETPSFNHLMNVAWFAATGALLYGTLRRMTPGFSPLLALLAALLFIVHPVHSEVVANIKSRDEILCFFFILLSINAFTRMMPSAAQPSPNRILWGALSTLAFLCALLSKESAITALPVFPLVAYFFYGQNALQALRGTWQLLLAVLVFFLLRGVALEGLVAPETSYMDNAIMAAKNMGERLGTAFMVMGKYLMLLIAPITLNSDYSFNSVPLVSLGNLGALASLVAHLALLGFAVWQWPRRHILSFCILAYFCSIALYSQIPMRIGTLMGERLLFTPSFWFCLALPVVVFILLKNNILHVNKNVFSGISPKEKIAIGALLLLSVLFALKTVTRNGVWKDNLTLFTTDVATSPNSVRLNDGAAEELYKSLVSSKTNPAQLDEIWARSNQHSEKSLSMESNSLSALLNMGNLRFYKKNYEEAAKYYEKALQVKPDYSFAKRNMMALLIEWARKTGEKDNNPAKARELLEKAVAIDKYEPEAWYLLGVSYGVQGDNEKAYEMFQKATKLKPDETTYSAALMQAMLATGRATGPKMPK